MSQLLLDQERGSRYLGARARSTLCPCEGLHPFCEACVPCAWASGSLGIQARRWVAWQTQEALLRRVEQAKRDHAGKRLPATLPALAARRTAAGLPPGEWAARACIGVPQILRIEAEPTHRFAPSLILRLGLAIGSVRDEAGGVPGFPAAGAERAERGREVS